MLVGRQPAGRESALTGAAPTGGNVDTQQAAAIRKSGGTVNRVTGWPTAPE